jgi:LmbE family N-acetylglucosaminyl deacetylase
MLLDHSFGRVLAIVAHFDDEALLCGGTLLRLRQLGAHVHICVVTDIADTNPCFGQDGKLLITPQHKRLVAFGRVCESIGASATLLYLPNLRQPVVPPQVGLIADALAVVIAEEAPDVVLSHGPRGDTGHPQHNAVFMAVEVCWRGPLWTFAGEGGDEEIEIDGEAKRHLLACYRDVRGDGVKWEPSRGDWSAPWSGRVERFDAIRVKGDKT